MGDDVVGQAGERGATAAWKAAEHQGFVIAQIIGVGIGERMWDDLDLMAAKPPPEATSQCLLESR